MPKTGYVTLKIYNSLGQHVQTLMNGKLKAGEYHHNWNAANFASGVYYYQINMQDSEGNMLTKSKKLVLIK